jgi:predicted aldo/keto reductase-like oxidoreductase
MNPQSRRSFILKGLMGLTGASVLPATVMSKEHKMKTVKDELVYRVLGKTGLKIPVISMGTGDTNNSNLVKAVHTNGIVLFGTSTYYGNGNNETMLGKVFKDLPRSSYLVATSSMPDGTDHQKGLFTDPGAGETFKKSIEGSMVRLGVNYLDILFLPFAAKRESVFFEPLLRVMEDFKKQGKARFIGIATHSYVEEAIRAATDTRIYDLVMTAYNFRMQQIPAVNEAISYCSSAGLGVIAMKTMAGSYWDQQRTQPINSGAALKWVLQNPDVHTVMAGMTTFDELQNNLALMKDLRLTDEDLKELRLTSYDIKKGLCCQQCGECLGTCKERLDIPTLMRSYMYAYGYRNLDHAKHTLDLAKLPEKICESCESCGISCSAGFDIRHKIRDIARLRNVPQDFLFA